MITEISKIRSFWRFDLANSIKTFVLQIFWGKIMASLCRPVSNSTVECQNITTSLQGWTESTLFSFRLLVICLVSTKPLKPNEARISSLDPLPRGKKKRPTTCNSMTWWVLTAETLVR